MNTYLNKKILFLSAIITFLMCFGCSTSSQEAYYCKSSYLIDNSLIADYYIIDNNSDYELLSEKLSEMNFSFSSELPTINENYFSTKKLILIPTIANSGSVSFKVTSVNSTNSQLNIKIKRTNEGTATCDMASHFIIIPIDASNCDTISITIK